VKFGKYIIAGSPPQEHPALSGVVIMVTPQGKGYAYVHFEEELVTRVGKAMPQGIGPDNPAYLKAMQIGERWQLLAVYVDGPLTARGVFLEEFPTRPEWLKNAVLN
jgi:hypothetical protein